MLIIDVKGGLCRDVCVVRVVIHYCLVIIDRK